MAIMMGITIIAGMYVLDGTTFGTRVKAIGGNEHAARLSGISVPKNKIAVYTMTGVLAAIGGIIIVGRLYAGNPNAGANFEMDSIAATIVGGTSLSGGQGTVLGTLLGSLLLAVIKNALILLSVSMYWQTVAVGAIIIIVCAIDVFTRRKK
jgi:ribose transport system permease protein